MAQEDFYASPFGRVYSTYMERPRLGRLIARVVWGGDTKAYYESMSAITEAPDGGTVIDCHWRRDGGGRGLAAFDSPPLA
jgi:hypothetical protein